MARIKPDFKKFIKKNNNVPMPPMPMPPMPVINPYDNPLFSDPGLGGEGGGFMPQPMPVQPMPQPMPMPMPMPVQPMPMPVPMPPPMPVPVQPMPMPVPMPGGGDIKGGPMPVQPMPQPLPVPVNPMPQPAVPVQGPMPPMPMPKPAPMPMPAPYDDSGIYNPRDQVIPPMPNENPVPFVPPVAPPRNFNPGIGGEGGVPFVPPPAPPSIDVPPPKGFIDPESLYSDPGLGGGIGGIPMGPKTLPEQGGPDVFGPPPVAISDPAGEIGGVPFDQIRSDFGGFDLSTIPGYTPEPGGPTGIETLAEGVGQGDFLAPTIPLPDGSTFDIGNLNIMGGGLTGGFFPEEAGGVPFNLGLGAEEAGGTTPDTSNGLSPAQQAALDSFNEQYPNGFNPDSLFSDPELDVGGGTFDPGIGGEGGAGNGPAGPRGPAQGGRRGNPPGYNADPELGGGTPDPSSGNADEGGSGNPYPFLPPGMDTSSMTPEQLEGLNNFYEQYPNGINVGDLNIMGGGGFNGGLFDGTGNVPGYTPEGEYVVTPVDAVGDLGGPPPDANIEGVDETGAPLNVRAASSYALTGVQPTMPVAPNPFRRPETQQGIGSLGGG